MDRSFTDHSPMGKLEERFVAVWCLLMPVTGTLLIPSVQGTIPAYVMAFCSFIFVLLRCRNGEIPPTVIQYLRAALFILMLWLFFAVASQLTLLFSDRHDFSGVNMVDPNDTKIVFRTSLFTQSIYLAACVMISLYFRYFFKDSWMKYVFYGGYLLAGYGIYEWLYFFIFHQPGDFLVNRTFGDNEHTGSWSQGINFGGLTLLRIKSTLGEPTFFAGVVLPYLFVALDYRKAVLVGMLIFTALFSTSTACYIGLISCLLVKSCWTGRIKIPYVILLGVVAAFLVGIAVFFPDTFDALFGMKFAGDNESGKLRLDGTIALHDLLSNFSIPNWLFGIGFGYTYLSVFVEALVNTGVLGLLLFLYIFFRPIVLLPIRSESEGLKMGLLAIAILFSLSLSELFLPTTWMFLGMAYRKLEQVRRVPSPAVSKLPAGKLAPSR
jgi:hypothetical protein